MKPLTRLTNFYTAILFLRRSKEDEKIERFPFLCVWMDCILNVIEHDYVDSQLLTVDKKIIPESKAPSTYLSALYSST